MFITQTRAIKLLKAETGKSLATCKKAVKNMPTVLDGARKKVHSTTVRRVIHELTTLPKVAVGIRPLSEKHLAAARLNR